MIELFSVQWNGMTYDMFSCVNRQHTQHSSQCSMFDVVYYITHGKRKEERVRYGMVWYGMVWYGMVRYESTPYYDENEKQNFKDSKKKMYCTMHDVDGQGFKVRVRV